MSYHKIESVEDFLKNINQLDGEDVVFHFQCDECGDEQVSYTENIDLDFPFQVQNCIEKNLPLLIIDCTECKSRCQVMIADIFAIEVV